MKFKKEPKAQYTVKVYKNGYAVREITGLTLAEAYQIRKLNLASLVESNADVNITRPSGVPRIEHFVI
jgi:hypothetical protein